MTTVPGIDIRFFPVEGAFPETDELSGRRAILHYASGQSLQQHWIDRSTVTWRGITGPYADYEQTERNLKVFKLAEKRYLITWFEDASVASTAQGTLFQDGYPVCIVADFERLTATAAYLNPREDGGTFFVVDQAQIELVDN